MQLKIVLCFLSLLSIVFLVPSDVYADDGGKIDGGKIVEKMSLEHDIEHGTYNSLLQIDSDTYALAYTSTAKKGWISTFTISPDGTSIVEVDTLNYSGTSLGRFNSLVHVIDDTYALAHSGSGGDGYISTFTISSDGAIVDDPLDTLEHDEHRGQYNSLVQVDSNTYVLAYSGEDTKGYISTFEIASDGTITPTRVQNHAAVGGAANYEHDENQGKYNSLVQVDSNTYALAYAGDGNDGYITTFTIPSDGSTITEVSGSILEHNTQQALFNSLVQVDSDTYALAYAGGGSDGYISTFTISSDGTSISRAATLEHDENKAQHNSLMQIDSDTYVLAYAGNGDDGYISTFTISSVGRIVEVTTLEHDENYAKYNSLVHVFGDTYALAYSGVDQDGYIATFEISQTVISSSSPIQYAPHIHDEVTVSINSNEKFNLNLKDREIPKITSRVGDTVDITISVGDDKELDQISQIKLVTNFAKKPSGMNKYFANNYNDYNQVGLSVYQWYQTRDDVKYDYDGTISWKEPSTIIQQRTLTNHDYVGPLLIGEEELIIVFSLNMKNIMDETQTITKIIDTSNMQKRSVLPFTLEVLPEVTETPSVESVEEIESSVDDKSEFFIKSNESTYKNGNKIVITGQIPIQDFEPKQGKNIKFSIISPENEIILTGQSAPQLDGSFIFETFAMDSKWKTDGDHIFNFNYGSISSNLVLSYDNSQFENVESETRTDEKVVESVVTSSVVAPSFVEEHKSTQLGIAAFVDQSKEPQHYADRYFNESKYKQWFDKNYPQYISIYEAVGLEEPVKENIVEIKTELPKLTIAAFVDQSKDPQHYIDRYFNESKYKQWFDKNYPQYISIYEAVGLEEPVVTPPVVDTIVEQKTVERILIKCGTGTEDVNGICQVIQTEEKSSSVKIYHSRR